MRYFDLFSLARWQHIKFDKYFACMPPQAVQSRFVETLTLTLSLTLNSNPNFGESGFGESGRHPQALSYEGRRAQPGSASASATQSSPYTTLNRPTPHLETNGNGWIKPWEWAQRICLPLLFWCWSCFVQRVAFIFHFTFVLFVLHVRFYNKYEARRLDFVL